MLLKNDRVWPLAALAMVAVIGPNAKVAQIMGGGPAQLNPYDRVSPWDGLVDRPGEAALAGAPGAPRGVGERQPGGVVRCTRRGARSTARLCRPG